MKNECSRSFLKRSNSIQPAAAEEEGAMTTMTAVTESSVTITTAAVEENATPITIVAVAGNAISLTVAIATIGLRHTAEAIAISTDIGAAAKGLMC